MATGYIGYDGDTPEDDDEGYDDDMENEIQDYIDRQNNYEEDLDSIGRAQTTYENDWYR